VETRNILIYMSKKKLKYRKIFAKLDYLVLEKEECAILLEDYSEAFHTDFKDELEFIQIRQNSEPGVDQPKAGDDDRVESSKNSISNKTLNALYKKIAIKVHPDVSKLDNAEELFMKAKEAQCNEDWVTLITLAKELNVEIPEFTEEEIEQINEYMVKVELEIAMTKNNNVWFWATASEEQKEHFRKLFLMTQGIDPTEFEDFLEKKKT